MSQGLFKYLTSSAGEAIDVSTWKEYEVQKIFKVETSKYHNPESYTDGEVPYVSRSVYNNGVIRHVQYDGPLYDGNCIIIGAESARAFYQEKAFITGNKIYRLYPALNSKLNKYIALYLCTILNKEGDQYSYTNAWTSSKIGATILELPSKDDKPDWEFMETFMKSRYEDLHKILC